MADEGSLSASWPVHLVRRINGGETGDFMNAIQWLKRYGYLSHVPLSELDLYRSRSSEIIGAVQRLQTHVYSHSQIGEPDGVLGPRVEEVMHQERCDHPDVVDMEIALLAKKGVEGIHYVRHFLGIDFDTASHLVEVHWRLSAAGSGSWPDPCQRQGVTVRIDTRRAPGGLDVEKLWAEWARIYRAVGVNLVSQSSSGQANIRLSWKVLAGSTIGLAEFNNQSCGDSVFCYLDPGYNPNFIQVGELGKHELGHNCNLRHTRGGTMSPTIQRVASLDWSPNDPSYRVLKRYFPDPVPDPDPQPEPEPEPEPPPNPEPDPPPSGEGRGVMRFGRDIYDVRMTLRKSR